MSRIAIIRGIYFFLHNTITDVTKAFVNMMLQWHFCYKDQLLSIYSNRKQLHQIRKTIQAQYMNQEIGHL